MTLSDFDPRLLDNYTTPKHLLHFQWSGSNHIYRYALVEILAPNKINSKQNKRKMSKEYLKKIFGKNTIL
jgi:hypothetical protein